MGRVRAQLGIAIGRDAVRAVLVRRGAVAWMAECERTEGESLAESVGRLVSSAPLGRLVRPRTVVALGPSFAQTKLLTELPRVTDVKLMTRLVAESSSRFFVRNGVSLVTTPVRVTEEGTAWAAAFEQSLVGELERICRDLRVRLRHVVPSVAVVPLAIGEDGIVAWPDGDIVATLSISQHTLRAVRRNGVVNGVQDASPAVVDALAKAGADAWRFADAYGAALADLRQTLGLSLGSRRPATPRPIPRWRLVLAGAALAIALTIALLAPGLAAIRAERDARSRHAGLATQRRAAALVEGELRRVTGALVDLATFDATRRSHTAMLADLTRALPEGTGLVAFRTDTALGSIVALTPRAAIVLGAMEKVRGIASPEIFGPVTKDVVNGREYERVTVRFRQVAPRDVAPVSQADTTRTNASIVAEEGP